MGSIKKKKKKKRKLNYMVQENIKNKPEGFGPLAPVFLEGA